MRLIKTKTRVDGRDNTSQMRYDEWVTEVCEGKWEKIVLKKTFSLLWITPVELSSSWYLIRDNSDKTSVVF